MVLHRHVCIVFLPVPPMAFLFWINQKENIDNDLYCNCNEFFNLVDSSQQCNAALIKIQF